MTRILLQEDILIESFKRCVLSEPEEEDLFVYNFEKLIDLLDDREIDGYITWLPVTDFSKNDLLNLGNQEMLEYLAIIKQEINLNIIWEDNQIYQLAVNLVREQFPKDFRVALSIACAIANEIDFIITEKNRDIYEEIIRGSKLKSKIPNYLRVCSIAEFILEREKYEKLTNLLSQQNWQAANSETCQLILKAVDKLGQSKLKGNDIENIPCLDLNIIDRLWKEYSQERFGFTIQATIWNEVTENYGMFCEQIGWSDREQDVLNNYLDIEDPKQVPPGYLPSLITSLDLENPRIKHYICQLAYESLFQQLKTCTENKHPSSGDN
ncbi:GUN4 domain-containing protein [Roseofilum casamattae]|uniref:GUN4 domain-containing protein n=1 Tax=Roseofilum casamattae BLCC-M143 TaxID=3022442 RepID=A0ABT7BZQ5_9CYAN|nr:GUN4 domain-containing protein [Roseofilum casamattae]MDJ1183949.1 GUN4 domain-containing protein [Roseofilum casamattae BLCC-M143]